MSRYDCTMVFICFLAQKADFAKLDNIVVGIRSVVTNKRGIEWMRDKIGTTMPDATVVEAQHSVGHWMDMFVIDM